MHAWLRWMLPGFLTVYLAAAFVWPTWRTWKQTGINPYALGNSEKADDYIGVMFRYLFGAGAGVVIAFALWPAGYGYLAPFEWLGRPALVYAGLGLLAASLVWTVIAQASMGKSWRIGIDTVNETELVTVGVYRISRNPIFLGMRATLLGLFLVLPNAVTLAVVVLGEALIQIQVRLEEEFLAAKLGTRYAEYQRSTRRWL
jgi:protein-S-isoprenylcysteine O-methyltransferase Ste14